MTFDDVAVIDYLATFDCGHQARYEAANEADVGLLRTIASLRLCPECQYARDSSLILKRKRNLVLDET